jgi:uncharacterized protein (DUF488 family)
METIKPDGAMAQRNKSKAVIFTIGHSTRPIEEFIELLQLNGVKSVLDIRTIPRSRRNPQFNREALEASLGAAGIDYLHLKELGGLRHAKKDSVNLGWHNAGFRGYADYMQTEDFESGLERAIRISQEKQCALMCAEAVPWRCHRSLVADALTTRGIPVEHILSGSKRRPHEMTPFARVHGTEVTYPTEKGQSAMDFTEQSEK